jgi:hypothetical protein
MSGFTWPTISLFGRVMAQAVSHRLFTAEARVRARVGSSGICGGLIGTGTGFSSIFSVFPRQYHSTVVLHTHLSSAGWTEGLLVAAVQRRSLTPSTRTTTSFSFNTHPTYTEMYWRHRNQRTQFFIRIWKIQYVEAIVQLITWSLRQYFCTRWLDESCCNWEATDNTELK